MLKNIYIKLSVLGILIIALETVAEPIKWNTGLTILSTYIIWLFNIILLFVWLKSKKYYVSKDQVKEMRFLTILLLWFSITIFRGAFIADDYWTTKFLITNSFGLLLPVVAYLLTNNKVLQLFLNVYVRYVLPMFLIFAFIIPQSTYAKYLIIGSVLILFIPAFKKRMRWTLILIILLSVAITLASRGKILTFIIPMILVVLYYFRVLISLKFWEFARKVVMFSPFILFYLAFTGGFNIFEMKKYIKSEYTTQVLDKGEVKTEDLLIDTRTMLYEEVLNSAYKNEYIIFGRTPARGNDTDKWDDQTEIFGKNERIANESGILNVFTWSGIIGIILYFLVFYKATYLSINKSNNIYSKMIGLFLAFRWFWSWVSEYSAFELSFLSIWILVAMSYSKSFRNMTNNEFKFWIRGITDKRYRNHVFKAKKSFSR
jgi:hypothetical protein